MRALSFGELLWDIIDGREYIGGAPFNLAAHLARMGAESYLVSAVGEDELGSRALEKMREIGVSREFINIQRDYPTGVVSVELDEGGTPVYHIKEQSAWDHISLNPEQLSRISDTSWDVLSFGSLAQREANNRRLLPQVVEAAAAKEVFFDVNLRLNYYSKGLLKELLGYTDILKLNDEELAPVSRLFFGAEIEAQDFASELFRREKTHTLILTRGRLGSSVYTRTQKIHIPVVDVRVKDTVGAGDSYSAAFLFAYHHGGDVEKAANLAALVSSYVAGSPGAVPVYDEAVRKAVYRVANPE
ncbi:MAG TPA: carbohydrate kinase [Sediminispirochaeta sp.]|nr:carbohydrate kinase [Sediminispirochaeta sp.]